MAEVLRRPGAKAGDLFEHPDVLGYHDLLAVAPYYGLLPLLRTFLTFSVRLRKRC